MARWEKQKNRQIPDWFWKAIETPSIEQVVNVGDCDVVYREWNSSSTCCLLFLHGMYAHSRWWDFIAPHFVANYRVVALDFTGMGDSDHRYEYSPGTYVEEILSVVDHAGLNTTTILVGHSFGGRMATRAVVLCPERFRGLVLVDSGIHAPEEPERNYMAAMPRSGRPKIYPNREVAESRFRLFPPQPCENQYVVQYIARNSVVAVEGGGYTWKFDPDIPSVFKDVESTPEDYRSLDLPVAVIYGESSNSYSESTNAYMAKLVPEPFRSTALGDAGHHVFLDQPLSFIDELQQSLDWIEGTTTN